MGLFISGSSVSDIIRSSKSTKSDLINSLDLINKCRLAKDECNILQVIDQFKGMTHACTIISGSCYLKPTPVGAKETQTCGDQCREYDLSDVSKQDALLSTEDELFTFDVNKDNFSAYYVKKSTNRIMCLIGKTPGRKLKLEHQLLLTYLMPHLFEAYTRLGGSVPMSSAARAHQRELLEAITCRELEILRWLAVGKTNWEIGVIVGISVRTVKFHLNKLFQKLSVSNRAQAVFKANALELVSDATTNDSKHLVGSLSNQEDEPIPRKIAGRKAFPLSKR